MDLVHTEWTLSTPSGTCTYYVHDCVSDRSPGVYSLVSRWVRWASDRFTGHKPLPLLDLFRPQKNKSTHCPGQSIDGANNSRAGLDGPQLATVVEAPPTGARETSMAGRIRAPPTGVSEVPPTDRGTASTAPAMYHLHHRGDPVDGVQGASWPTGSRLSPALCDRREDAVESSRAHTEPISLMVETRSNCAQLKSSYNFRYAAGLVQMKVSFSRSRQFRFGSIWQVAKKKSKPWMCGAHAQVSCDLTCDCGLADPAVNKMAPWYFFTNMEHVGACKSNKLIRRNYKIISVKQSDTCFAVW